MTRYIKHPITSETITVHKPWREEKPKSNWKPKKFTGTRPQDDPRNGPVLTYKPQPDEDIPPLDYSYKSK